MGQGEDHVQVTRGEQFLPTRSDPAIPSSGLTFRAVAVPAAVVGDGGTMSTAHALIEMPAERGGTTPRNGPQYFHVLPMEPVAVLFGENNFFGAGGIWHPPKRAAPPPLLWGLFGYGQRAQKNRRCGP